MSVEVIESNIYIHYPFTHFTAFEPDVKLKLTECSCLNYGKVIKTKMHYHILKITHGTPLPWGIGGLVIFKLFLRVNVIFGPVMIDGWIEKKSTP